MNNQKDFEIEITRRKKGFTQVYNHFLEDCSLSWKAKGIFIYILSRPKGWKLNIKGDVSKRSIDKERAIYSGIKELVESGYISRTRNSDFYIKYHFFEFKEDNNISDYLLSRDQNSNVIPSHSQNAHVQNAHSQNAHVQNSNGLTIPKDNNNQSNNTEDNNKRINKNSKQSIISRLEENGVDKDLAIEVWDYRKDIAKSQLTDRALSAIINNCTANNFNLSEALIKMMENGWKGFKAEWVQNQSNVQQKANLPQSRAQQVSDHNDIVLEEWIRKRGIQ